MENIDFEFKKDKLNDKKIKIDCNEKKIEIFELDKSNKIEINDINCIEEDNFDWKQYIDNYDDLKKAGIDTKDKAWKHWMNHGKLEGRNFINVEYQNFDWKQYIDNYDDLKKAGIDTKDKAWKHWMNHGKLEGRNFINVEYQNFDWNSYLNTYDDLEKAGIDTKDKAWKHWNCFGKNEGRQIYYIKDTTKPNKSIYCYNFNKNMFLNLYYNSKWVYYNVTSYEIKSEKPGEGVINTYIVLNNNISDINDFIKNIYELYTLCECDILCPLITYNDIIQYFGGYVLNSKIEIINNEYLQNFDEKHVLYYTCNTNIIHKYAFISNSLKIVNTILNNNDYFQFTKYKALVSPYININREITIKNDSFVEDINDGLTCIEKECIVENYKNQYLFNFNKNIIIKNKKTVLIGENSILTPFKDCGSMYVYEFIRLLLKCDYEVHFFSCGNHCFLEETPFFKKLGVCVHYHTSACRDTFTSFLQKNNSYFDYIFLSRWDICEKHLEIVRKYSNNSKLVYITHDICHKRMDPNSKIYEKIKYSEIHNILNCDLSLIVSTDEVAYLETLVPKDKLLYYPICYSKANRIERYNIENTKDIYFIGSSHPPNIDALKYFLQNIWSHVLQKEPNLIFHIIGSCGNTLHNIPQNVIVHGFMEENDLLEFFKSIRVNIVPLLSGAGMKGKLLQSMNNGIPIMSSEIGIQGMNVTHEKEIILLQETNEKLYAEKLVDYYNNINLLQNCANNSLIYFDDHFSMEKSYEYKENLFNILDNLKKPNVIKKYKCCVLCVIYSKKKIIDKFIEFFKSLEYNIQIDIFFIVNNYKIYNELYYQYESFENIRIVKGDNSTFEFSGFQTTINQLLDENKFIYDSLLLTNETLFSHFPASHIRHINYDLFYNACTIETSYGYMDTANKTFKLHDKTYDKWLRANFILINNNILKKINYKVHTFNHDNMFICDTLNKFLNTWLQNDRYSNVNSQVIRIKKICILNEHYLSNKLFKYTLKYIN